MNMNVVRSIQPVVNSISSRLFSTSTCLQEIRKMARMRVVDNSSLGKAARVSGQPARVIHVYTKNGVATLGDKVLVAVKGQKKKAFIVGVKQKQKAKIPRFDTNNIVLIEDNGAPIGNKITVPLPSLLRKKEGDITKVMPLANRFV
ncbi:hypothetical protein LOTGIDRAFT_205140 [Lottia gigantea]|uniref:Large ribosomal subunit protein uL14m n=1 Tax=Lottia gigantea TaxID=225164 RepID=V4B681_LOTGI|nr:hypothetical protein LOTGIDRAFT_205140 [Lottia gigantea]ESP01607.1 hypothetical protein LOTGIDRAFT_205140 [Lottia gigantea]